MSKNNLPTLNLDTLERIAIGLALANTRGNRTKAAHLLGVHVRTLHRKLRLYEAEGKQIKHPWMFDKD